MTRVILITLLMLVSSFSFGQESKPSLKFSLQQAVDYAMKNSYAVRQADKDMDYAEEKRWETTATGLPQIDGKLDYRNWIKQQVMIVPGAMVMSPRPYEEITFGTKQTLEGSLTVKQLLFNGTYLVGLQSAKTYLKISEQAKKKTKISTREAVVNAYGNVLLADASIKILESNKANIDKTLNETREIYKNGFAELESVEQLEITAGMLENNLRNAKRMRLIALQMFNIAIGNKNNDDLDLTDSLESLSAIDMGLLTKVFHINDNVDYQILLNSRRSNELLMKLEQTKYLPTLSAFFNYGFSANNDEFKFFNEEQRWIDNSMVGVRLDVPIFSSLGRAAKVKQARINLHKTDIQLQEVQQKLELQAAAAKSEYQLSIENLANSKRNLELSQRILDKNQIKFKSGLSSSFDLFQAQNQLFAQQNNYIQSMLDLLAKKTKLETVLQKTN